MDLVPSAKLGFRVYMIAGCPAGNYMDKAFGGFHHSLFGYIDQSLQARVSECRGESTG